VVAVIILSLGLIAGNFLYNVVERAVKASSMSDASVSALSGIAKWAVVIFALMAALVQLGIASSLIQILFTGFEWQRTGKVDEISRTENEEIRERLEEKEKLFITKAEFEDMIQTLGEQMKSAADAQEYHRASMIKDRMRELDEEMKKNELGGAGHKPGGDLMF
jgi:hypothetical protein